MLETFSKRWMSRWGLRSQWEMTRKVARSNNSTSSASIILANWLRLISSSFTFGMSMYTIDDHAYVTKQLFYVYLCKLTLSHWWAILTVLSCWNLGGSDQFNTETVMFVVHNIGLKSKNIKAIFKNTHSVIHIL